MIDIDAFEERAAIMEFDGGMSRFRAETLAAEVQGSKRHEVINEIRRRNSEGQRHRGSEMDRQQREDNMPGVQRDSEKKTGSVPKRDQEA